jgi:flagellin
MALVINTNTAASAASVNLNRSNAGLQKSLARLSSGSRITNPSDDAGGLAVSMKLTAAMNRTKALNNNLQNAQSFLQSQDGAMKTATTILDRISELKVMASDVTKGPTDKANYNTEFLQLQEQLTTVLNEKFNGVDLFAAGSNTIEVIVSEDGNQTVGITQSDLAGALNTINAAGGIRDTDTPPISVGDITGSIQSLATLRASNGAVSSRLTFSMEMLQTNAQNLEAANSRIVDTDIAYESTQYARYNILVQSGTAMLAQANQSSQAALQLLRG